MTQALTHTHKQEKVKHSDLAQEHFTRIEHLLNTLGDDEAIGLDNTQILTRLFHDELCRLFDAQTVEFGCLCSASKSLEAVKSLGHDDVQQLINEQKEKGESSLVIDCHFCFQRYHFNFEQVQGLFQWVSHLKISY